MNQIRPEDSIVTLPELKRVPNTPEIFERFIDEITPILPFAEHVAPLLEVFATEELRLQATLSAFAEVPDDATAFILFIKTLRSLEAKDDLPIERAVQLYGLDACRDLLFAISRVRAIHPKPVIWNHKTNRPAIDPGGILRYAHRAVSRLGEGSRFPHHAYVAGSVFDAFKLFAETRLGTDSQLVLNFIDQQYLNSEYAAKILVGISKKMKTLELVEFAIPVALLHCIGRIAIASLRPLYVTYSGSLERSQLPRSICAIAEEQTLGISFQMLSYLIGRSVPSFAGVSPTLLHQQEGFTLDSQHERSLRDLTNTLSLSINVAKYLMRLPGINTDGAQDAVIEEAVKKFWMGNELKEHELLPLEIFSVAEALRASQKA